MTTENEMVTEEMIAARAYERYVQRGCEDGHDVEDWLAAEGELRSEMSARPSGEASPGQSSPRARTSQAEATAARL